MSVAEEAFVFNVGEARLLGVLHAAPAGRDVAVLVVVGGPQYRVGSHRQFVELARFLASRGYPVLRFDCRGMGDSEGEFPGFERIGPDIAAAMAELRRRVPTCSRVAVFGLCDGASAALMYVQRESGVEALLLANPWVRSQEGEARAFVEEYYGRRLLQRSFWAKLFSGKVNVIGSVRDFARKLLLARRRGDDDGGATFQEKMKHGFERFEGRVALLLSGRDLVAAEFRQSLAADWAVAAARSTVQVVEFPDADHTFSAPSAGSRLSQQCLEFLASLEAGRA